MNRDRFGEIVNGVETFKEIAKKLREGKSVIIGWTDEEYTHYDILFTGGAYQQEGNYLQRGLRNDDLFISIMSVGAFGFYTDSDEVSAVYVAEKLGISGKSTIEKFAELINGIKQYLYEVKL